MSLAYKSRYLCDVCEKYHKNGSKAQEKCEKENGSKAQEKCEKETEDKLKNQELSQ